MTSENNILNIFKNGMFEGNSQSTKTISKTQLINLQEKAEKYENLKSKYEALKSEATKLKEKVKELKSKDTKLESVQKESERHLTSLKRVTADFENYRKRKERQNEAYEKRVRERIENYKKLMKEEGLEKMECEGKKFDSYKHEALMVEENNDLPQNTITEVFEDGYLMDNEVIKPAKVKVSKKSC